MFARTQASSLRAIFSWIIMLLVSIFYSISCVSCGHPPPGSYLPAATTATVEIPTHDSTPPVIELTVEGIGPDSVELRSGVPNQEHEMEGGKHTLRVRATTVDKDGGAKGATIHMQVSQRCTSMLAPIDPSLAFALHEPVQSESPKADEEKSPGDTANVEVTVSRTFDVEDYTNDCIWVKKPVVRVDLRIWATGENYHGLETSTNSLKISVWSDRDGNATDSDTRMALITDDDPDELQTEQKMGAGVMGVLARFDQEWSIPEVLTWFSRAPDPASVRSNYADISFEERRIQFALIKFQNEKNDDWAVPGYAVALKSDGETLATKFIGLAKVEDKDFWDDSPPYVDFKSASRTFASDVDEVLVWQTIKWSFFEPDLEEYEWIDLSDDP